MTPIWIFPAYPLLLTAPLAANLIDALPSAAAAARINSLAIALAAVSLQGTGFLVSLMVLSAFIYRLMTQKIPRETTRPGMVGHVLLIFAVSPHSHSLCISPLSFYIFSNFSIFSTMAMLTLILSSYPSVRAASPLPASCISVTSYKQKSYPTASQAFPKPAHSSSSWQTWRGYGCGAYVCGSCS